MIQLKAYKFRLETTQAQHERLLVLCGHARFIWNHGLRHCLDELNKGNKCPGHYDLTKLVPRWKKEFEWLKEGNAVNYQQKLKDLQGAWSRCFKKLGNKPRFKKKSQASDSIRIVQFDKYCKLEGHRVKLPAKLGFIKFRKSQDIQGAVKNCTITQSGKHWFISFQVEQDVPESKHPSTSSIGLDMGITQFVTLSDGTYKKPLNAYRKTYSKLAKAQRCLSKKKRFSQNWKKQKSKVNKIHTKIANSRKDFLHKVSTEISNNHAMIAIEDLKVSNMSAHGGAYKKGLNKSILDQGWSMFRDMLEYKQTFKGGLVVAVPAHYTSQTCPSCGHVSRDNRKTQAKFHCVDCGYDNNADIVGAINVRERGHRLLACGE